MCPPVLAALPAAFSAVGGAVAANALPVAIMQGAAGIGSAVAGHMAQEQAYKANRRNAVRAFGDEVEALNARGDEIQRSASDQLFENEVAALQERGRARTAGVGLADVSLGEVLQGVNAQTYRAGANIKFNRDSGLRQNERNKKAADAAKTSRINSVAKPNLAALGFNIVGSLAEAGTTYSVLKQRGANQ